MEKDLTNEEMEVLSLYRKFSYKAINQLLTTDAEEDIALISNEDEEKELEENIINYSKMNVVKNLKTIKSIYSLMLKMFYKRIDKKDWAFSRGTGIEESDKIKNEMYIDRILSASCDKAKAKEYAVKNKIPVVLNILGTSEVPFLDVDQILGSSNGNQEILISPFTKVEKLEEAQDITLPNGRLSKVYNLYLSKQVLNQMNEEEKSGLYTYIISNADLVNSKLKSCVSMDKENNKNYDNIRKLENLLSKYEAELDKKEQDEVSNEEIEEDLANIARVNKELESLKDNASKLYEKRKEECNFITNWKKSVTVYVMAESAELDELYQAKKNVTDEMQSEKMARLEEEIKKKQEKMNEDSLNEIIKAVKEECNENIAETEKLINEIKGLILKQQNHAKIAGNLGTSYSALNNGFEMKKYAEELNGLVKQIAEKVQNLCEKENRVILDEKLLEISKTNIQINTLINYLNNPKSSIGKAKVTRFDEMAIVEENALKKGVAQEILNIRAEAELKKLKDDIEIIEEKSTFKKVLGMITGRNKIDEIMLEQIEIRQKAIRKTLAKKLELSKNYSIHELIAEIEMFQKDNEDDELIEDEVFKLISLGQEIRRNFVVSDAKVDEIINKKEAKNLPIEYKKISKKELIEIETYRFLNKYGYDIDLEKTEPPYQDTMANEIYRIIEYINSSKILSEI
jgi:hypothetical protein